MDLRKKMTVLFVMLIAMLCAAQADAITIAKKGVAECTIIVAKDAGPAVRYGADELARRLLLGVLEFAVHRELGLAFHREVDVRFVGVHLGRGRGLGHLDEHDPMSAIPPRQHGDYGRPVASRLGEHAFDVFGRQVRG